MENNILVHTKEYLCTKNFITLEGGAHNANYRCTFKKG